MQPEQDDLSLGGDVEYAADQSPAPSPKRRGSSYSETWLVEAGSTLVNAMVSSGLFDWADIVTSIQAQLDGDSPFITPKQFRALTNIAEHGRIETGSAEESWWDIFVDENPETARIALEQANPA